MRLSVKIMNTVERMSGIYYARLGAIHRQDCSNLLRMLQDEPDRVIAIDWVEEPKELCSAVINIEAFDRHGLLRGITTLLYRERVSVSTMQAFSNKKKHTVNMMLTIEISDLGALSKVLARMSQLPNVWSVRRQD